MGNARQIKILSDVNGQFVYYSMFSIPTYIDQDQVILSFGPFHSEELLLFNENLPKTGSQYTMAEMTSIKGSFLALGACS